MRRTARRRAIVFDLDGTLMDSLSLVLAAIRHAIQPFGGEPSMEIFGLLGGPPESFMRRFVSDAAQVSEALRRMSAFQQANGHLIRPYSGARSVLEHVGRAGGRAALWTGRDRDSASALLRAHGFDCLLTTVVCGDDLPSHKPDPSGLREILRRLEVRPEEVLLVGDADVDVLGGHACGVDTVLIRNGRTIGPEILAQSWQIVAAPADAYDLVRVCLEGREVAAV